MIHKKRISYFFLAGIYCFILSACKKIEQPEMAQLNKECDCAKEVSADFVMEEVLCYSCEEDDILKMYTPTDTIYASKNVRFRALEDNAEYTWYIGSEVLNTQSFFRFFGQSLMHSDVSISLVVKKQPNLICNPLDDGYDSITKTLSIRELPLDMDTTLIEGTYRVKSQHLADSFDVKIDLVRGQSTQEPEFFFNIYNFDGVGSNSLYEGETYMNFRECFSWGYVFGRFKYTLEGVALFNFTHNETEFDYKGRKL